MTACDTIRDARCDMLLDSMPINTVINATTLADDLGVSTRTIYRYVDRLRKSGHPILGEPGVGYMLRPKGRAAR